MSKETRSLDKKGFSNKFFEILDKEHDNAKIMSKRQKELKKKQKKLSKHIQNSMISLQESKKPTNSGYPNLQNSYKKFVISLNSDFTSNVK